MTSHASWECWEYGKACVPIESYRSTAMSCGCFSMDQACFACIQGAQHCLLQPLIGKPLTQTVTQCRSWSYEPLRQNLGPLSPCGLILRRWVLCMWQSLLHMVAALLAMGMELARSWCPCALCPRQVALLMNC